jgi:hypothetical protein
MKFDHKQSEEGLKIRFTSPQNHSSTFLQYEEKTCRCSSWGLLGVFSACHFEKTCKFEADVLQSDSIKLQPNIRNLNDVKRDSATCSTGDYDRKVPVRKSDYGPHALRTSN